MIQIRQATLADLDAIIELFEAELQRPNDKDFTYQCIANYPAFVVYDGSDLIAELYTHQFCPDILEVINILVKKAYRSQKVGKRLLQKIEAVAPKDYSALILTNSMLYKAPK